MWQSHAVLLCPATKRPTWSLDTLHHAHDFDSFGLSSAASAAHVAAFSLHAAPLLSALWRSVIFSVTEDLLLC